MAGRPAAHTIGGAWGSLPVLLKSEILSKGRILLPSEAVDKIAWLAPLKKSAMPVALEVLDIGYLSIIPSFLLEPLFEDNSEGLVIPVRRRTLAAQIDEGRRLALPKLLEETILPRWSSNNRPKVVLECHATHIGVMTPDAWVKLVRSDATLDSLISDQGD